MSSLSEHVRSARRRIAIGYALVVCENILGLLWPLAIGLAIDDLIDGSRAGLWFFAVLSLSHTATSFIRQRFESRTFNPLYAEIAEDVVQQQREAGVDTASVSGRTELLREYVEFLGVDVPLAIAVTFTLVGSLAMLFFYDTVLGLAAAAIAIPVILVNRRLMRQSQGLYEDVNDLAEVEVAVISGGRRAETHRHFGLVSRQWVRLSDAEAASWSIVEVVTVGLWVLALVRATSGSIDAGETIAVIAYVAFYSGGFEEVPGLLQRLTRLPDIRRRLSGLG